MTRTSAITMVLIFIVVSPLYGEQPSKSSEPGNLNSRITVLEMKNKDLESRLVDHTAHVEAIRAVSQASIATIESTVKAQMNTLSKVITIAGYIVLLIIGVGTFFGVRTWQDMQKIHKLSKEAEQPGLRIREKIRFDELSAQIRLYIDCNQIDDALSAIDEVMNLKTIEGSIERQSVYFSRATCLKRKGQYIEAFNNAIDASKIWPSLAKAWYNAACYASLASTRNPKYKSEAVKYLRKAYELSPRYTVALALAPLAPAYDAGARKKLPERPDPDLDPIRGTNEFREIFRDEPGQA